MPDFKSISFKMAVLQGGGQNLPPHVCVIQKTAYGIGLRKHKVELSNLEFSPEIRGGIDSKLRECLIIFSKT